jgi:hypothetical protein
MFLSSIEVLVKVTLSKEIARSICPLSLELLRDWQGWFNEKQQEKKNEKRKQEKQKKRKRTKRKSIL